MQFFHLRTSNFKIFSNHGGRQRLLFGNGLEIFLLFVDEDFQCSVSHLRSSNFQIFSNHGGRRNKCFAVVIFLLYVDEDFQVLF